VPDRFGEPANSLGEWPTGKEDLRYSGRNGPEADQALRRRFSRMAAVLRDMAFGCHVVRARPIFHGSDRKLGLDGERRFLEGWALAMAPGRSTVIRPWRQQAVR